MLKKEVKRRQWGIPAVQTAQRAEVDYFMPTATETPTETPTEPPTETETPTE